MLKLPCAWVLREGARGRPAARRCLWGWTAVAVLKGCQDLVG